MHLFRFAALWLIALVAPVMHASEAEQQLGKVQFGDLRAMFSGLELSDQVHYFYQFHSDGRLTGINLQEEITGKWRTEEGKLCLTLGQFDSVEECYEVRKDGDSVSFYQGNLEFFYGYLTDIK